MKMTFLTVWAICVAVGLALGTAQDAASAELVKVPGMGELRISEPQTHKNLTVFVLYRSERPERQVDYLTLDEAAKAKLVEITEAKNEQVRQLAISYTGDQPLFLIAGELVTGGKQDRTLESSLVIPPGTKYAVLPSFCVEQSRWSGGKRFMPGNNLAPNASQQALNVGAQRAVWGSVSRYKSVLREKASAAAGTAAKPSRTSSLNEELADTEVKDLLGGYEKALAKVGSELACPLGLAYAVDGKVTAVHVFHSSLLFAKLKPRLIRSAAIDATVGQTDKQPPAATPNDLRDFLAAAGDGRKTTTELGLENVSIRYVNDKTFTSLLEYQGTTVHSQVGRFDKTLAGGARPRQTFGRNARQQWGNLLPQSNDGGNQPQQTVPRQSRPRR
ncbi:MAG: hypothetical protein JW888_18250 [Pirellulales bacterium]|nr:hypothetical protein [Pirellulales bacterium]